MKPTLQQNQNRTSLTEKDQIIIFVFSSTFEGRKIRVNPFDSVSILFQLLTSQNIDAFYQGNILNPKSTFFDCEISLDDRVILMNRNQIDFKTEIFWKSISETEFDLKTMLLSKMIQQ
jgi:hypothetical protein